MGVGGRLMRRPRLAVALQLLGLALLVQAPGAALLAFGGIPVDLATPHGLYLPLVQGGVPTLPLPPTIPSAPTTTPVSTVPSSPTPTSTHTPTVTPEAGGDLKMTGRVYDDYVGLTQGISGATVSVVMCVPRRFPTESGPDGDYTLLLPGTYLDACRESQVTIDVWATGYLPLSLPVSVQDLRAQPRRDLGLVPRPWFP